MLVSLKGFNFANWSATLDSNSVTFTHLSPDGDCGYPGDLLASVRYQLTESGEIRIEFRATSTAPTIVNMANHAYFNLGGHNAGIYCQQLFFSFSLAFTAKRVIIWEQVRRSLFVTGYS